MRNGSSRLSVEVADPGAARDPIAIIGIGCRFAGIKDSESFWRVLHDGIETVGSYPGGRFRDIDRLYSGDYPTKLASCRGGFLPNIDLFDAEFFGISPREAALMDPQQRLLLEVAWEATEDAGILAKKLSGTRTGVFVGLWTSDYETCVYENYPDIDLYVNTGTGRYAAAGRLAYFLDLQGPTMTVDTACSSSLVAVHLACQSLRSGESDLAMAGGVNLILRPEINVTFSRAGMLSPEGSCKFGDASADGYVRSEGAGIVLLKRLSQALEDGDPIYATIRGSSVNHSGRSSGLLVRPGLSGQENMIRTALQDAGLNSSDIDYIEAHGTGTPTGDSIEIEAIGRVMATFEREHPCSIGSVKTNIGHTEAASGIAGIIKTALALERGVIPASLHFKLANTRIRWDALPIRIQSQSEPWPQRSVPPIAGVSGFGITGTNAHALLQGVPPSPTSEDAAACSRLFLLSAHTPEALRSLAESWETRLSGDSRWPASLADLAFTAAVRRTHHDFRLTVTASNRKELQAGLSAWLHQQSSPDVHAGRRMQTDTRRAVFVFPGQGGQWMGMGAQLFQNEPVFRETFIACDQAILLHAGWSVIDLLITPDHQASYSDQVDLVQPALFAVMISLAALWKSWGVKPAAVVGHSMGECAAAVIAGALSLNDGAAVICHRSRLMKQASGRGLMALAELSFAEGVKLADKYGGQISVAANNSPTSIVFSGDADAIERLLIELEQEEIFCRKVRVDVASHSGHMDRFRQPLVKNLQGIEPRQGVIPFYSTTTGHIEDGIRLDSDYWGRNLRQPVLFSSAVQSLLRDGFDTFIEINSHPVLLHALEEGIRHSRCDAMTVGSTRRDKEERAELLHAMGALYVSGYPVDFRCLYPRGKCLRLPLLPWQRERHWLEENPSSGDRSQPRVDSKLGAHLESSLEPGVHFWEVSLPETSATDIEAHCLELILSACSETLKVETFVLSDLEFSSPPIEGRVAQLAIVPNGTDRWVIRLSARGSTGWATRVHGSLSIQSSSSDLASGANFCEAGTLVGAGASLAACFKMAAEAAAMTEDGCRVIGIRRLVWRVPDSAVEFRAHAASSGDSLKGEALCWITRQDGSLASRFEGVRFGRAEQQDLASHVYELHWQEAKPPQAQPLPKGIWIICCKADDFAKRFTGAVEAAGNHALTVQDVDEVEQILNTGTACLGIIYVAEEEDPYRSVEDTGRTVRLVQALTRAQVPKWPRVWLVTRGNWQLPGDNEVSIATGSVWAAGRTISREHPELRCSNIDLSYSPDGDDLQTLAHVLRTNAEEDQFAIRGKHCFVARFERSSPPEHDEPTSFSANATYLLTGGLGGIGLNVARWMASKGALHLVLVGRKEPSPSASKQIEKLRAAGVTVQVFTADVSDESKVKEVLHAISLTMPPLRGIFHLAAVMDSTLAINLDREELEQVMLAKATGAWVLHRCSAELQLDFFVLFSSMSAVISQPGLLSYAAANGFLDSLARYRRSKKMPALSIQWGVWSDVGLVRDEKRSLGSKAYEGEGIDSFSADSALHQLERILQHSGSCLLAAPINWPLFTETIKGTALGLAFSKLCVQPAKPVALEAEGPVLKERLLQVAPGRDRREILETHLKGQLGQILRVSSDRIDAAKPFGLLGVDSLMALELVRKLASSTHIKLPATTVFNFPTIHLLSEEVARRMDVVLEKDFVRPGNTLSPLPATLSLEDSLSDDEAIEALIGMVAEEK